MIAAKPKDNSQRQELDALSPLVWFAAIIYEQKCFYRLADRGSRAQDKETGHGLAGINSHASARYHGAAVLRNNDPILGGGPFQYLRILRRAEADLLDADQVDARVSPARATDDVTVNVRVTDQAQHGRCPAVLDVPAAPHETPDGAAASPQAGRGLFQPLRLDVADTRRLRRGDDCSMRGRRGHLPA